MSDWRHRIAILAAALWWGSLTAVGAWVVPLLFVTLSAPALAGNVAARLFGAQTWVALACGLLLMFAARGRGSAVVAAWARGALGYVAAGLVLALLTEYSVAPRIVAREDLRLWHAVGSAMYLVQWLCAGIVLWKLSHRDLQVPAADSPDTPDQNLSPGAPS